MCFVKSHKLHNVAINPIPILFSNEAWFHLSGYANSKNNEYPTLNLNITHTANTAETNALNA
jgi:hypothetical protein